MRALQRRHHAYVWPSQLLAKNFLLGRIADLLKIVKLVGWCKFCRMNCVLVGIREQVGYLDGANFADYFATFVDRDLKNFFGPTVLEVIVAGIILQTLEFLIFD